MRYYFCVNYQNHHLPFPVHHFQGLFERLSLTTSNGLFIYHERDWEGVFSIKIEQTLEIIKPFAFFTFNNEPVILFFDSSKNTSETHTSCWNFNVTPIIFFVSETDVNIYNAFELKDSSSKEPLLKKLAQKGEESNFTYWNIASGQTFEFYQKELEGKNRVDQKLLANIKVARNVLISGEQGLKSHFANNLIGRLIFVRYLIDRKIRVNFEQTDGGFLSKERFLQIINSKEALYELFSYLQGKFKGDLFPIDDEELNAVKPSHLAVLFSLFNGDEITSGQLSLFEAYKFDIIPIEFISNIYEYFMGDDKQKAQKTYYTPTFLVNYVLNNTVSKYFYNNPDEISCKVLDPTCGSGIFLVESLRRIVEQYQKINGKNSINNSVILKELVAENIYGIDKDRDAIDVAMFSLYITLLDYQEPKDIENFEFPSLLNRNFFVQDIFKYSTKDLHFEIFEPQKDDNYIAKLLDKNFRFIIGNPPWGDVKDSPYMERTKEREKLEKTKINVSFNEFAQAFIVRTSDFCKKDTQCAVVITSKILYNNKADVFRKYFLNKFFLDEVLELSAISDDVFLDIDTPTTILFYKYAHNQITDNNQVKHISIKHNIFYDLLKIFVIEKNDIKILKQSNFKNYDWIWKVLLYGNALDFQFIKRLKNDFPSSIQSLINDKDSFIYGTGVVKEDDYKKEYEKVLHYVGKPFLNTQKKQLSPFLIQIPTDSIWVFEDVKTPRNKQLFEPPMLLVKEGISRYFKVSACISVESIIFTNSVASIKSLKNDIKTLHCLEGLFHSTIFTYFQLETGSSIGVQRRRILREELYSFPYLFNENVSEISQNIESELKNVEDSVDFYKLIEGENNAFVTSEKAEKLKNLYSQLNETIYDLYDVNDIEKSLIDYAENFSIPLFHNEARAFKRINEHNQNYLEIYANVFFEHFKKVFNGRNGQYFQIEAHYNKYFVCMAFKILEYNPESKIEIFFDESLGKSGFLANLSLDKKGENLYIQKDIKHFETNEFLIIKPNEMKCWHKSLAYKDLFEIREEIVKANQQETATT